MTVFIVLVFALGLSSCDFDTLPNFSRETGNDGDIDPSPSLFSVNLTRCNDCKDSVLRPYAPRHNGKFEVGAFWEVPIKTVGDSIMPIHSHDSNDFSNQILVVDSYEQLNSLRIMVGFPNVNRPVTHNYTPDFFDSSALIFVTVYTHPAWVLRNFFSLKLL